MKKLSTFLTLLTVAVVLIISGPKATAQPTCQAGFVYSIGNITPNGATVSLFDSSWANGNIISYSWDFGNGTADTAMNPVTFLNPGYNYVCLTIVSV